MRRYRPLLSIALVPAACSFLSAFALRAADVSSPAPVTETPAKPQPPPPRLLAVRRERLAEIFSPDRTENATLSPDGRYIAYSVREGEDLSVLIVEIDHPQVAKSQVKVGSDRTSTPAFLDDSAERIPAAIRWMRWVTPTRLVVETNGNYSTNDAGKWVSAAGMIFAVDADGANGKVLVSPRDVVFETLDFEAFAKGNTPVFQPVQSVDQPASDTPTAVAGTADPSSDGSNSSAAPALQPTTALGAPATIRILRSPRIHDFMAGDPNSVLIRAEGGLHLGRYKLDVVTGKLTALSDEILDATMLSLLDRQARPRGGVPANLRIPFPHAYVVETGKGLLRWKKLDEIAGWPASGPGFHVGPEDFFGTRAVPIAFDENPDVLYYASNRGRDTYGIYSLDLKNPAKKGVAFENPHLDFFQPDPGRYAVGDALVFDRFHRELVGIRYEQWWRTARWLRPAWQDVQTAIEKTLPGRSMEILEWDEAGKRFLVYAHGPTDPGTYFVYDATKPSLAEFVRRSPAVDEKTAGQTALISFQDSGGRTIGALLTVPGPSRPNPAGLVVLCASDPWQRLHTDYRREVEALAEMGLAVLQINARGAFGFGLKQREALKPGFEETQIADILATLDYLQKYVPLNFKRVMTMGTDWGGFVALRAVQLHPDRFRGAVTIDPTVDPGDWLDFATLGDSSPSLALTRSYYGDAARLKAAPLQRQAEKIQKPVLLLSYRGPAGGESTPKFLAARRFASGVRPAGGSVEFDELSEDYMRGLPLARAATFEKIGDFLNEALFKFEVKVGETKEVKP